MRKLTKELAECKTAKESAETKGAADARALKAWKSWFEAFSRVRDQELPPKATKLLRDWTTWRVTDLRALLRFSQDN